MGMNGDPVNCRFGSGGEAEPEDHAMTNDEIRQLEAQADAFQAQADAEAAERPYRELAALKEANAHLIAALVWIAKKSDMGGQLPSKQTCRSWAIEVGAHARAALEKAGVK